MDQADNPALAAIMWELIVGRGYLPAVPDVFYSSSARKKSFIIENYRNKATYIRVGREAEIGGVSVIVAPEFDEHSDIKDYWNVDRSKSSDIAYLWLEPDEVLNSVKGTVDKIECLLTSLRPRNSRP
jgi:hypothetical protein